MRSRDRENGANKVDEGTIELPEDVYGFGMLAIVVKNLKPGEALSAHAIAFTPKPRVLKLAVTPDGEESVTIEGLGRKTQRYQAKAELGGAVGAVASVTHKQLPPLHIWMAGEPTPTFVRFDGPVYADGPIWRVELAAPRWADDTRR